MNEKMTVTSEGIIDGVIADKYGKRGTVNQNGMPIYSLPLDIHNAPAKTKSFVLFLEDKDAYGPSGGFSWVHWLAANIQKTHLDENESQNSPDFVQGHNSWTSMQGGCQSIAESSCYGGMAPPDSEHIYELHVYAIDTLLPLENGFGLDTLFRAMDGHVLASYTLKGRYRN